jgi:hypothetical protein
VEPDRVLAAMLSAVHPLLATRAAYLDRRVAQTSERMVAA